MKLIHKLLLITSTLFFMTSGFAAKIERWEIKKKDDGYTYSLWLEDPDKLIFIMYGITDEGKTSDYVTIFCNGKENRMGPNSILTCYGSMADMVYLEVKEEDFHNGAKGINIFTPRNG